MPLTADTNILLTAPDTDAGTVTISWSFPFEIQLFESLFRVDSPGVFSRRAIPDTQLMAGSYTQPLRGGRVYHVRAFKHDAFVDPTNESLMREAMLGEVIVHALRRPGNLQSDFNEAVGGTFYRYDIATGSTPTHALLEIGIDPPTADAAGFRTLPSPIMTVESFQPLTLHSLTTDDVIFNMMPEDRVRLTEARFALITVVDSSGQWEQVLRTFQTRQRQLTIDLHTIDVQSIGEPASETEGEMRYLLEVWDFDGQNWSVLQSFGFENHHATLTPFSVRNYVPNPVVVIGPRPVRGEVAGLALHVLEFDPWPFEDEHASSMVFSRPQIIRVQPGEAHENRTLDLVVRAAQEYDPFDPEESLIVDLLVRVTVAHF